MKLPLEPGYELMLDNDMRGSPKGERMMRELAKSIDPADTIISEAYTGKRHNLILYGVGRRWRMDVYRTHIEAGGNLACWDLGYWDRSSCLRLAVNGYHPQPHQLTYAPEGGRFPAPVFELREDSDPNGPILLIGIGDKSCVLYGLRSFEWETKALRGIRKRFGDREVIWRPKGRAVPLHGLTMSHGDSIQDALRGKSLVVCRHSNVAVDAAVAGVPVWCFGGAAVALYGDGPSTPTREARARFLRQLEWWNWSFQEASGAWSWIRRVCALEDMRRGEPVAEG